MDLIMFPTETLQAELATTEPDSRNTRMRTCVMPIPRHSSSQRSFSVPFVLSWYSAGITFSIALGSCTCRYSNSLSEYLGRAQVSGSQVAVACE
jgi:hypothetical protein